MSGDNELLKKYSRKYRIPTAELEERARQYIPFSRLTYDDILNLVTKKIEEERREKAILSRREHGRVPYVSDLSELSISLVNFIWWGKHNISGIEEVDAPNPIVSVYDADWDGMASQAIVNSHVNMASHFITYHNRKPALDFIRSRKPKSVLVLDYGPHHEIEEMLENAHEVLIMDKHIRPDLSELAEKNLRIKWFNTRDYGIDSRPLSYLLWQVAKHRYWPRKVAIPAILGNYGYGWAPIAEHIAKKENITYNSKKLRGITTSLMRLVGLNHRNSAKVVEALSTATSFDGESIRQLMSLCRKENVGKKYEETIRHAIDSYRQIGDVAVFPIWGWETTKPFTFKLRQKTREMQSNLAIIVDCNDPAIRKISIRTANFDDPRINVSAILNLAYSSLPPTIEGNYGGHESSGGAVCKKKDLPLVLENILKTYFQQTGQEEEMDKYGSVFEELWYEL